MTAVRLTRYMRGELQKRLLEHAFSGRVNELIEARARFARRIYHDVLKPVDRVRLDELPEGWVPTASGVKVQFGGSGRDVVELSFNGWHYLSSLHLALTSGKRPETVYCRVPYKMLGGICKVYESTHHLAEEWAGLSGRILDLVREIDAAGDQIKATVHSVSTVGALVKGWPEVETFVAGWMSRPPALLPALPVMALNNMLGLPPDPVEQGAETEDA